MAVYIHARGSFEPARRVPLHHAHPAADHEAAGGLLGDHSGKIDGMVCLAMALRVAPSRTAAKFDVEALIA